MLNKGPHVLDAMHTLDEIWRRMQAHQTKKRNLLRALRARDMPHAAEPRQPTRPPGRMPRSEEQGAVPAA